MGNGSGGASAGTDKVGILVIEVRPDVDPLVLPLLPADTNIRMKCYLSIDPTAQPSLP
jgi:hypothetical protein